MLEAENVVENEEVKLLWNFTIQADREIHHRNQTLKYSKRRQVRRFCRHCSSLGSNVLEKEIILKVREISRPAERSD